MVLFTSNQKRLNTVDSCHAETSTLYVNNNLNKNNIQKGFTKSKLLSLILLVLSISSFGQTTYTWTGTTSTVWTVATNWSPNRTAATSDILQFNTGTTLTITAVPAQTVGRIVMSNNTNITLQGASAITLTIGNSTGDDLDIPSGSSLTIGTNVSVTMANSATASIAGTLSIITARTFNTNGTSVVTTVTGTLLNAGTVTCTTASKLLFNSGSTYTHSLAGGTIPTATWATTSTCNVIGITSALPSGLGQTFSNFMWNCPSQVSRLFGWATSMVVNGTYTVQSTGTSQYIYFVDGTSTTIDIAGNLNVSGGQLRLTRGNGNATVNIMGNVEVSSGILTIDAGNGGSILNVAGDFSATGGTITETGSGSGSINFTKAGTQLYTSGIAISNTINFTVKNGSTLQMAAPSTIVDGAGTFTIESDATLGVTSPDGITTSGTTGNIQVAGTRTYTAGASYIYNGSAAQAMGNGLTQNNPLNLTITNPGNTVSLGMATTISGALTVNTGSTLALSTYALGTPTSITIGNSSGSYAGGIISGSGLLTLGGNISVGAGNNGNTGAIISCPIEVGAADRTFDITQGASEDLSINGVISGTKNIIKTGDGRLVLGGANTTFTGTMTVSVGTLKIGNADALGTTAGATIVASGAELDLNGITLATSEPLTLNGVGINNSGDGALINTSSPSHTSSTYNGAITLGSDATIGAGSGDIILGANGVIGGFNLEKVGTYNLNLGSGTSTLGTVTVSAGTLTAPGTVNISGDFFNDGTFDAEGTGTINLNGASAQSIGGTTTTTTFNNLTLSGGGAKSLAKAAVVNKVLTFTSGILTTTSTYLLTIADGGSVASASTTSFVNGPMAKIGNTAFDFPVGAGTKLGRIGISAPSTTTTFTAQYFNAAPSNSTSFGSGLNGGTGKISTVEYWNLTPTGTPTAKVVLHWESNTSGITSLLAANLVVAHYTGSAWISEGNAGTTVSGAAGTLTSNTVSTWSPFTFGSPTSLAPLPVKLISFTAKAIEKDAILNWSTATEKNNDHFDIERSNDGVNFTKVGAVNGAGNSTAIEKYSFTDTRVADISSQNVYYRLKQIDFDGNFEYSNLATITFAKQGLVSISNVQPNPFVGNLVVNFNLPDEGNVTILIIDAQGRIVASNEVNANKGNNIAEFNTTDYAKGLYFISVNYKGSSTNYKMLVKE